MKKLILLIIGFALVSPSFSQLTLSDSLIAHYPFNNNANDSTGNGYNGTVYGATLTEDRFGTPNSAYEFDGVDDFINCDSILDVSSQDTVSISTWFYPQQIFSNNQYSGLGFGKKTTGTLQLRVRTDTDSRFQAHHASAFENNSTSMRGNSTFNYNQWYHLVAIYSDNNVKMYINGSAQTFNSGNGNLLSNIPQNSIFRIGSSFVDNDVQKFFHGKLDEIRVYNRGLSNSEIDSLYNESNPVLSIPESSSNSTVFEVFPNPVSTYVTILSDFDSFSISLIDSQGKQVFSIENEKNFPISNLPNGIYHLVIKTNDSHIYSKRLIINK